MLLRPRTAAMLAMTVQLITGTVSSAATITSVSAFLLPGSSTGTIGPIGATPAVNNDDDPGASPNVIPISTFLNSPGAIETEFVLANSGGTTEYRFTQSLVNTISAPWIGFRFELGSGTGAGFVQTGAARFDVLNGQSTATSPQFTLAASSSGQLDWTVGTVPFAASFSFAIDVPDGPGQFTLRQTPLVPAAVPEPGTLVLAAIPIVALLLRKATSRRAARSR